MSASVFSEANAPAQPQGSLKQKRLRGELPPQPSAARKRMMDINATAYPGILNADLLPDRALLAEDFTAIDSLSYRKGPPVKNQNAESAGGEGGGDAPLTMMTTSQMASKMMQLGLEIRRDQTTDMNAIEPRGYRKRNLAPPFDARPTYRLDYCQELGAKRADNRHKSLAGYRNDWGEVEKADVDGSMRYPYLTLPKSLCKDRPTMYRRDYIPDAGRQDFRTLSCKTNLDDLGASFAYSAYTDDDERRRVHYDESVAKLRDPHSVLEKTFTPRDSFADKTRMTSTARAQLDELRAVRRETVRRSVAESTKRPLSTMEEIAAGRDVPLVIPGMRGQGYRLAPEGDDKYVYLPRDHFCHGNVDDF